LVTDGASLKLERHIYEWDKIVIGGDLRSLLFAVTHNYPVIFVNPSPPFRFDVIDGDLDLSKFGFTEQREVNELELWERMFFILGLSGLCPLSSRAQSMRVKENTLIIATENLRVIKAKFNKLVVFEPAQLQTLPEVVREEKKDDRAIDWFNVRYGCKHELDVLHGKDNFISRIHFYPTDRSDNKTLKDAVSISYLDEIQIQDLDFSEYMARFKVEHMMKESGIRGPINGYRNKKPIYLGVKIEHAERQIVSQTKRFYRSDDRYKFRHDTLQDILKKTKLSGYSEKMARML
jgi:hypothetical protein